MTTQEMHLLWYIFIRSNEYYLILSRFSGDAKDSHNRRQKESAQCLDAQSWQGPSRRQLIRVDQRVGNLWFFSQRKSCPMALAFRFEAGHLLKICVFFATLCACEFKDYFISNIMQNFFQRGSTGSTALKMGLAKLAKPIFLLVAGIGFEPMTFGL